MELLGKATRKEFWQEVAVLESYESFRRDLFILWDKYCTAEIPAASYKKFKTFAITGERSGYEWGYYFPRRLALCASVFLSLVYPEEEKYIERAQEEIFAICNDYSWALPAHITNLLDNGDPCTVDLFSCETAFALSETYWMLGDRLEPLIRSRIEYEIDRRIIKPFCSGAPLRWQDYKNNWNAVCCGSIGCTFMLMRPDLFQTIKPRLDRGMEIFLSSFNGDGTCTEGINYWNYGFGFFTVYADMLRTFTGGAENYFAREDVRLAATFINKVYISGRCNITFSDASRGSYYAGLVDYLSREYPEERISPCPEAGINSDGCGRFCIFLRSATWLDCEKKRTAQSEATYFAPTSQVLIHRGKEFGFAIKGGHNYEAHNHNDLGSFIFATEGRQILVDGGSSPYCRSYFDKATRYDFLGCSSRGHSVPIIGGNNQKFGEEYATRDTKWDGKVFSTDISGAYGLPELVSLVRRAELLPRGVRISDTFDYRGEGEIVERFVSFIEPTQIEDGIEVGGCPIRFAPADCRVSISSEPFFEGGCKLYMIDLTLPRGCRDFSLEVKIKG